MVKSSFFTNLGNDDFTLPENSYYKSLEKYIGGIARGEDLPPTAMRPEEFGREVVRDVLRGKSGNTYSGTLGWAARWLPVVPTVILVGFINVNGRGE